MNRITVDDVRRMTDTEGLVLQGCGGDLQEWIDGINETLTEEGILLGGDTFKQVSCFEHEGLANLLFHLDDVKLNVGRLAIWRLQTHEYFGGIWLSDFMQNQLDVHPEQEPDMDKPECPIIGADSSFGHGKAPGADEGRGPLA